MSAQTDNTSPFVVLHLEDDPSIQRAMRRVITKFGSNIEVISVPSVAEGIPVLAKCDAVISDWDVVGGTGRDLFESALATHPHLVNRYLFVSSSIRAEEFCLDHDIPFLEKPAAGKDLTQAIAALMVSRS